VMLLVLSTALMPGSVGIPAASHVNAPCGKAVCCCPQMCKMKTQAQHSCLIQDSHKCGIASAPLNALFMESGSFALCIGITGGAKAGEIHSDERFVQEEDMLSFKSLSVAPLDKPPTFIS